MLLVLLKYQTMLAQNPVWISGNQVLEFSGIQSPQVYPLPEPQGVAPALRYNGQIADFNQIIQFDQKGRPLFFIIDASIYDAKGYLIASGADFCPDCNNSLLQGQLAVTMVPGHCNQYYIVYPRYFGVLDLLAQNENFPADSARKGALISLAQHEEWACEDEPDSSQFEGHFQQSLPTGYEPCGFDGCYNTVGCHPTTQGNIGLIPFDDNNEPHDEAKFIEILEVAETGEKYLFVCYSPQIDVYRIEETGIFYFTTVTATPLTDAEGWVNGNFSLALAEIDSILALQQYAQLLEWEESVRGEWPTLDSLQRSNVETMLDQDDNYSHTFTRTILQEIDSHYPEAEPRVPLEFRSAKEYGTTDNTPSVPLLGAWPNPAVGTVWVSYPAELDGGCSIKLLDALGKEVNRFTPTNNGLISIETAHLPKGLYLLQLVAFETSVETIKLLLIQQP
jgi:hypothetical protein